MTFHSDAGIGIACKPLRLTLQRCLIFGIHIEAIGVDASRIETVSYGKERPSALGSDEQAWAQNRRDEFAFELPSRLIASPALEGSDVTAGLYAQVLLTE